MECRFEFEAGLRRFWHRVSGLGLYLEGHWNIMSILIVQAPILSHTKIPFIPIINLNY